MNTKTDNVDETKFDLLIAITKKKTFTCPIQGSFDFIQLMLWSLVESSNFPQNVSVPM